jgi:hypothetical protein
MRYIRYFMNSFEITSGPTTEMIQAQLGEVDANHESNVVYVTEPLIIPVKRYEDGCIRAVPRLLQLYPGIRDAHGKLLDEPDYGVSYDETA